MALVEEDRLLKVPEAARILGIAPQTLYIWNAKGLVPSVRVGPTNRGLRFQYSALVRWMGENTAQGAWQGR